MCYLSRAYDLTTFFFQGWIAVALKNALNAIKLSPTGVFVQASTLGSMEALLEYLRSVKVPVSTKKVFLFFSLFYPHFCSCYYGCGFRDGVFDWYFGVS